MKKMFVAAIVVALLATSSLAMAQGWWNFQPRKNDWGKGMKLSSEQTQKLNALQQNFQKDTASLRREIQSKQLELKALWVQANPDQGKILAKEKEMNDLRDQLQEKTINYIFEARKILTPEQQTQMGALPFCPGCELGFGMKGLLGRGHGQGMGFGPFFRR